MGEPARNCVDVEDLILRLHEIGGIKFGNFTLKSGVESPVYFDLRVIVSYPNIMNLVQNAMWEVVQNAEIEFRSVCGVPYTALPIATCISVNQNIPMLIRRKEAKGYGTKKMIEGHYTEGETCLVIEDVVTSGSSVLETVESLKTEKIRVTDAIVLLDREQGGCKILKSKGINLYRVCCLSQVLEVLERKGKLSKEIVEKTKLFLTSNQFQNDVVSQTNGDNSSSVIQKSPWKERQLACIHPVLKQLYEIMGSKETNLCVAIDRTASEEVLKIADRVGPYICLLKTHADIIEDFSMEFTDRLLSLSKKHNFLIFEDRKFADIGNTVKEQYSKGMHHIVDWAHITNAHPLPGPGVVLGLKNKGIPKERGCLLIAEMSSTDNLISKEYTNGVKKMAEDHKDFVIGFICQSLLSDSPDFVHMTPGVQIVEKGDNLGQQYVTPEDAVCNRGADVIIVGRGITGAINVDAAALEYKECGYKAYLRTVKA